MDQGDYIYYDIYGKVYNETLFEYYYDTYEIETIENWVSDSYIVEILNKVFVVASILIALTDFLLLLTVFSSSARQKSATWYLYHFNFLTILHVIFSLQSLEGTFHKSFGSCMFFAFTSWTFNLLFSANLILMDIEIIATMFTASARWKTCPIKRFFISMTTAWIFCLLTSVIIMFFGHEEHAGVPICVHQNTTAQVLGVVLKDWLPFLVSTAFAIAGVIFFIRSKRRPENYYHMTDDGNSVKTINEWFACFMAWNTFVSFSEILVFVMHFQFYAMGIAWNVVFQITIYIIQIGLPVTCVFLEPVRAVCREWAIACFRCMTSSKRPHGVSDTDRLEVEMETC